MGNYSVICEEHGTLETGLTREQAFEKREEHIEKVAPPHGNISAKPGRISKPRQSDFVFVVEKYHLEKGYGDLVEIRYRKVRSRNK